MSEVQDRLLFVFIDMILPLALGYIIHQRKLLPDSFNNLLIRINIIFFITILTLFSFWILPLSPQMLLLPMFGILCTLLPAFLAKLFFLKDYSDMLERGSYLMCAMLSNIGTLCGLCAFLIYGEHGFAYIQLIASLQNVLFIALCIPLAEYYRAKFEATVKKTSFHLSLRMFITWNQLGLVGMFVGLALNIAGVERPEVLGTMFKGLIHVSAWSALLPVGYLIDFRSAKKWYSHLLSLIPMHFLFMPILIYIPAHILFDDSMIVNTLLLAAAAPSAINAVLAARINKLNVDFTIASFLLTTVIFLLIIFPAFFLYVTKT